MHRMFTASLPVCVAITALVLAAPSALAQQEHEHSAGAAATHTCACCGNSSAAAMNHAGGAKAAGQAAGATTEDHSAHQAAPAATAAAKPMEHGAGMACCGTMAKTEGAAKAEAPAMNHGAGGCAMMNHDVAAGTEAKPMDHTAAAGCCADMKQAGAATAAKPMAMGDASMMTDMQVFHFLLDNRADVRRTVTMLPNGIDTLTESDKPEVAAKIKVHVAAMYARLKDGKAIHQRDPLFVELFAHADQIDATITATDKGLHVVETSTDPAVAILLHKHAETVNSFIKNGMPEMMKNHLE